MEAATELKGTVVLAELDGTEDSEIAKSYGVSSYPTIKLFVRGEVVDTYDGSRTKQDFIQYIADQRAPPVPNHVVTLTAENFMETVRSNSVVFVKFHAPYGTCGLNAVNTRIDGADTAKPWHATSRRQQRS